MIEPFATRLRRGAPRIAQAGLFKSCTHAPSCLVAPCFPLGEELAKTKVPLFPMAAGRWASECRIGVPCFVRVALVSHVSGQVRREFQFYSPPVGLKDTACKTAAEDALPPSGPLPNSSARKHTDDCSHFAWYLRDIQDPLPNLDLRGVANTWQIHGWQTGEFIRCKTMALAHVSHTALHASLSFSFARPPHHTLARLPASGGGGGLGVLAKRCAVGPQCHSLKLPSCTLTSCCKGFAAFFLSVRLASHNCDPFCL